MRIWRDGTPGERRIRETDTSYYSDPTISIFNSYETNVPIATAEFMQASKYSRVGKCSADLFQRVTTERNRREREITIALDHRSTKRCTNSVMACPPGMSRMVD